MKEKLGIHSVGKRGPLWVLIKHAVHEIPEFNGKRIERKVGIMGLCLPHLFLFVCFALKNQPHSYFTLLSFFSTRTVFHPRKS